MNVLFVIGTDRYRSVSCVYASYACLPAITRYMFAESFSTPRRFP